MSTAFQRDYAFYELQLARLVTGPMFDKTKTFEDMKLANPKI